MPGLINLHQHHWYCLFKGIADGMLLGLDQRSRLSDRIEAFNRGYARCELPMWHGNAGDRHDLLVQPFRGCDDA